MSHRANDMRLVRIAKRRRSLRNLLDHGLTSEPLLAMAAMNYLSAVYGGFWRAIWARIVWHVRGEWYSCRLRAWQRWAVWRGKVEWREDTTLHALGCQVPDDDEDHDCVEPLMPHWLR